MASTELSPLIDAAAQHTEAGIEAFTEAATKAADRPERATYLVSAAANTLGMGLGRLAAAPTLALDAWRHRGETGADDTTAAATATAVTAGGLAQREQAKRPHKPLLGTLAITAQYGVYAWLLKRRGATLRRETLAPRATAWGVGVALAGLGARQLVLPVLVGGAAMTATSALANDKAIDDGSLSMKGIGHAGNLAMVAQGVALLRQSVFTVGGPLGWGVDSAGRGADAVAQLLFVEALNRK